MALLNRNFILCALVGGMTITAEAALAEQIQPFDAEFEEILSLDLADLMVTSVSKRAQRLTDAPAAIYVITQEEIRRAGVLTIPDALRLAPGVQVARVSSNRWAVSARGFNGTLSNKLLVLIDGRSIYTPIFSGTYWDDQSTLIQDIDRIEVIRGPGASLWGANAVNGIVNIITKSSAETQGNLISGLGNQNGGRIEGRHGGKVNDNATYRTYLQYLNAGSSVDLAQKSNNDDWERLRTGFRMDGRLSSHDSYTFQGDAYGGQQSNQSTQPTLAFPYSQTRRTEDTSYGGNLLGRWNRTLSRTSEINVQSYVDYYARKEQIAEQHVGTADIQFQHSLRWNERNHFVWGAGARTYVESISPSFAATFEENYDTHEVLNAFAQDEYALVPNTLYLTLGSKFEHNDFTGFEVQPSARLAWHPSDHQTVWAAVSRAVRTPSKVEDDINLAFQAAPGTPPTLLRLIGNNEQKSEKLVAYELGHRIQPRNDLSFDTALFYNDYEQLATIGYPGAPFSSPDGSSITVPYRFNNQGTGNAYGAELAVNWNATKNWRLTGSYSYINMDVDLKPGALLTFDAGEDLAPHHQFTLRSYLNVSESVQWDNMFYYVSAITPPVSAYLRYDTRVGWRVTPDIEVSLIGRNLLDNYHPEFPQTPQAQFGRAVIGQTVWKF